MSRPEIEPYYQKQAQNVTDTLSDKKYLRDDVTRNELRVLEDYIAIVLQTIAESAANVERLTRDLKK